MNMLTLGFSESLVLDFDSLVLWISETSGGSDGGIYLAGRVCETYPSGKVRGEEKG